MMNLLPAILLISGLLVAFFFAMGLFALVLRIGCAFHSRKQSPFSQNLSPFFYEIW